MFFFRSDFAKGFVWECERAPFGGRKGSFEDAKEPLSEGKNAPFAR